MYGFGYEKKVSLEFVFPFEYTVSIKWFSLIVFLILIFLTGFTQQLSKSKI